jgi:serine protease SohB
MDLLFNLLLFGSKTLMILVAILIVIAVIFFLTSRGRARSRAQMEVEKLNDRFKDLRELLQSEILPEKEFKALMKSEKKVLKKEKKSDAKRKKIYVLDFDGDIRASAVQNLREEVSAVLSVATNEDEVVLRLESPGGLVSNYGLAASQLQRLRDKEISLTICVDKVAASGGYMMACVGRKILAAPFAVVGSIGVVASVPNFHKVLQKHDVDYREITAGQYKRTVTMFGEITKEGLEKFKSQLEETHELFRSYVQIHRPQLNIEKVTTGEYWYGTQALDLKLVDGLQTSDDYLMSHLEHADIYKISYHVRKRLSERLAEGWASATTKLIEKVLTQAWMGRFGH